MQTFLKTEIEFNQTSQTGKINCLTDWDPEKKIVENIIV